MLRDQISRSVVNTEGPMATMEDDDNGDYDNTCPDTPEKGLQASLKRQKIKEANDLLTTILYNPTRKGLNGKLSKITREQKYKLFRNFSKNFPEKWWYKFD